MAPHTIAGSHPRRDVSPRRDRPRPTWRSIACLPRRSSDRLPVFRDGALRPGKSSVDGGIEELSLLRPTSRSSPATRSASRAFAEASSSITTSRDAHDAHPGAGGGIADTKNNDQERSAEINTPRRGGPPATGRRQPAPSALAGDLNVHPPPTDATDLPARRGINL